MKLNFSLVLMVCIGLGIFILCIIWVRDSVETAIPVKTVIELPSTSIEEDYQNYVQATSGSDAQSFKNGPNGPNAGQDRRQGLHSPIADSHPQAAVSEDAATMAISIQSQEEKAERLVQDLQHQMHLEREKLAQDLNHAGLDGDAIAAEALAVSKQIGQHIQSLSMKEIVNLDLNALLREYGIDPSVPID